MDSTELSCHECIKGTIHEGQPEGVEENIHGLNTYIIGNRTSSKAIIVIYSDIFGLGLPNNKSIADAYAKSGNYLVYLPDFFQGDPVKLRGFDVLIPVDTTKQSSLKKYMGLLASAPSFVMWMTRHKEGTSTKVCMDFLTKLRRTTRADQKIGMFGFYWGRKYAIRAGLKSPARGCSGGLHPSHLAVPDDVENLVVPVSYRWGLDDTAVSIEQKGKVEAAHAKAEKAGRKCRRWSIGFTSQEDMVLQFEV